MMNKRLRKIFSIGLVVAFTGSMLMMNGCKNTALGNVIETIRDEVQANTNETVTAFTSENAVVLSGGSSTVQSLNTEDMFTERDLSAEYDESECTLITLDQNRVSISGSGASAEGSTVTITEEGTYLVRGTLTDGSIVVEASDDAKVQIVLDGANITRSGSAAIYAKTADKVFVTLAEGSENTITNTGEFAAVDENNIDGAVYAKTDLVFNGTGKLTVLSENGHGIVSKDDLKIADGTYVITAGDHGISGKDSIRIANGNINITSVEDGLHSGNDEDPEKGYVYIEGGTITVNAEDDGIHGESKVVISGGAINIENSKEGIESAVVELAGGEIFVNASDDGINATDGSGQNEFGGFGHFSGQDGNNMSENAGAEEEIDLSAAVYVLISGGTIKVTSYGDGIDSNGNLYVTGGETCVSGSENNGNGALDYDSKGVITGGTFVASGSSGMAMNFNAAGQGSALLSTSENHKAGEEITLKDSNANVLLTVVPETDYNCILISTEKMKQGESYTVTAGNESLEITMDSYIFNSTGAGGFGGQTGFMRSGENGENGFGGKEGFGGPGENGFGGKEGFGGPGENGFGGKEGFGGPGENGFGGKEGFEGPGENSENGFDKQRKPDGQFQPDGERPDFGPTPGNGRQKEKSKSATETDAVL